MFHRTCDSAWKSDASTTMARMPERIPNGAAGGGERAVARGSECCSGRFRLYAAEPAERRPAFRTGRLRARRPWVPLSRVPAIGLRGGRRRQRAAAIYRAARRLEVPPRLTWRQTGARAGAEGRHDMSAFKHAFSLLQKIGKCMMLPVSVLPVAGILLGVGSANFSWLPETLSQVMATSGSAIFGNLPLLFAIGVAIGLTNNDGVSALAGTVGYVVFLAAMGTFAKLLGVETTSLMGIASIETGVFGGILVGFVAAMVFNRFYRLQLRYLGFFAGKRSVPIITAFAIIALGALLSV